MKRLVRLSLVGYLGVLGCDHRPQTAPSNESVTTAKGIAAPAGVPPRATYETAAAPLIERYCLECHDSATKRGDLVLDDLEANPPGRETWSRVADTLRLGTMPPGKQARPSSAELDTLLGWLDAEVFQCDASSADPGRVTLRRLNRAEYDNTIRDLFGLDLHLAAGFPADDVGYGFDNIGDVLTIPPMLLEKYLIAADAAIDAASCAPAAWSRIMNPAPDTIPPAHRRLILPARSEPVKRIGRPSAPPPAPAPVDPEVLRRRQASEVLRAFADRAFRRPVLAEELARLLSLVESARQDGDPLDEAIRFALKAVLISPNFLFHVEEDPEPSRGGTNQPINDFALAARLSYFVWSGPPDDELSRLAARGDLRRDGYLAAQVRRLLRDDKAQALVDGFAAQWLQLRTLKDVTPDPKRYPGFDDSLRQAMLAETTRFVGSIIREDRSVLDFLDADYTFLNERLARHYGINGVVGDQFRRVSLAGQPRRGVWSQASILTVTSNPTQTSPVKRGKWILDNLLGMPSPPPPDGVNGLSIEAGTGQPMTPRQQLERHRANPGCASCHDRLDPLGFSLENFDAIGAWRSVDQGVELDVTGPLAGGESFDGPAGLRSLLLARQDQFLRCLAEKLLTSALGRGVTRDDRCFVDQIVRQTRQGGDRFSSLVLAIVASPPFQNRSVRRGQP